MNNSHYSITRTLSYVMESIVLLTVLITFTKLCVSFNMMYNCTNNNGQNHINNVLYVRNNVTDLRIGYRYYIA